MPFNQNSILLNEPVGLVDIFPTLLKLSGLDANPKHQGHSLVPLLNDVNANWDHAALTYFGPENIGVISAIVMAQRSFMIIVSIQTNGTTCYIAPIETNTH